ncbi:hypothetical protein C2G38_451978 [Gigaspora rosea]|uniref:Protein kinase domain-containing protein n=1 Tax=Gigaspora rosea TaxID=44941 RepID=A0A397W9V4_9GLOM|nr:hypothetical protein C2G38_451978 [Gigaspora rosea]
MFIHEYANEGTYVNIWVKNFVSLIGMISLTLQNTIKCLHESDIVHLNLNPKNILVHKGNLKLNEFGAFQYQNKFLNKFNIRILNI